MSVCLPLPHDMLELMSTFSLDTSQRHYFTEILSFSLLNPPEANTSGFLKVCMSEKAGFENAV